MKTDDELAAEGWKRTESASRGVRWERGGRTWERDEVEAIREMLKAARNRSVYCVSRFCDAEADGFRDRSTDKTRVHDVVAEWACRRIARLIREAIEAERTK